MTNLVNPYRFAGGGGPFSPSDVSGLILWLDATDLTTLWKESARSNQVTADGDEVGAWDDKSGNGNHWTQPTATKLPLYKENFNTSYPGLLFDGSNDFLQGAMAESADDWTIFAVCIATGTLGYILDWTTGRFIFGHNATLFSFHDGVWSTGDATPSSPSVVTFLADSTDGTSATIDINRVETLADDYTQQALGGAQALGSKNTGTTNFWAGYIASVLLYRGILASGDIASIEDYLADRYGITF